MKARKILFVIFTFILMFTNADQKNNTYIFASKIVIFDPENYIGQLNKNTKLTDILIVQSHDSGCTDQRYLNAGWFIGWLIKKLGNIVGKLANCQILSLKEQLKRGIRGLDIRVDYKKDKWRFVHGPTHSEESIESQIDDIIDFAISHPNEIIFIFIRPENTSWPVMLDSSWYKKLTNYCLPYEYDLSKYKIKDIISRRKNIILINSESGKIISDNYIWGNWDFKEFWSEDACGADNRNLKMTYFRNKIEYWSDTYLMYGIKIPNTNSIEKLKKFLKFFQNETSIFPLKDAKEVTYNDSKELIDWINANNKRINLIGVDGVGIDTVDSAIRYIGEFNLRRNKKLYK